MLSVHFCLNLTVFGFPSQCSFNLKWTSKLTWILTITTQFRHSCGETKLISCTFYCKHVTSIIFFNVFVVNGIVNTKGGRIFQDPFIRFLFFFLMMPSNCTDSKHCTHCIFEVIAHLPVCFMLCFYPWLQLHCRIYLSEFWHSKVRHGGGTVVRSLSAHSWKVPGLNLAGASPCVSVNGSVCLVYVNP